MKKIGSAQPWADRLARVGYMAKGAVYLLVGGLALAAAAGLGGKATDPSGALAMVARTSIGRVALGVIAPGLVAHATFCAALMLMGEPHADRGPVLRAIRKIGNAISALIYFGLAATATALSLGWGALVHTDKDAETRHWSARVLAAPFGRPLLIAVAAVILIAAAVALVRVFWPGDARRRLRIEEMSERQCKTVAAVGRIAFLSRATVLAIIGYFLGWAAIDRAPREARGPGGALHAVWEHPHGDVLLAMMAGGLITFGAYALFEARWRRLFNR
jgi:hypothetical protein